MEMSLRSDRTIVGYGCSNVTRPDTVYTRGVYTATQDACGWAGIKKLNHAFGQKQQCKTAQIRRLSEQGRIHGYHSRVRVGRGYI